MKYYFLLLYLIIISVSVGYCNDDSQIVFKKKSNGIIRTIHEGKNIKVVFKDYNEKTGKFKIINDTIITLNEDTVSISNIRAILAKPTGRIIIGSIIRVVGYTVVVCGGILIIAGVGGTILLATAKSSSDFMIIYYFCTVSTALLGILMEPVGF